VPAGSAVLPSGVVVGVDGDGLSSTVVVGVDGAGRAGEGPIRRPERG
jgi:hypothetical protein